MATRWWQTTSMTSTNRTPTTWPRPTSTSRNTTAARSSLKTAKVPDAFFSTSSQGLETFSSLKSGLQKFYFVSNLCYYDFKVQPDHGLFYLYKNRYISRFYTGDFTTHTCDSWTIRQATLKLQPLYRDFKRKNPGQIGIGTLDFRT